MDIYYKDAERSCRAGFASLNGNIWLGGTDQVDELGDLPLAVCGYVSSNGQFCSRVDKRKLISYTSFTGTEWEVYGADEVYEGKVYKSGSSWIATDRHNTCLGVILVSQLWPETTPGGVMIPLFAAALAGTFVLVSSSPYHKEALAWNKTRTTNRHLLLASYKYGTKVPCPHCLYENSGTRKEFCRKCCRRIVRFAKLKQNGHSYDCTCTICRNHKDILFEGQGSE